MVTEFDDLHEVVSPLDERFPKWQPQGGGNGIMRAVFGLLYEHGPLTRDELSAELARTLSEPSLAYVRRCYLHGLGRGRSLHSIQVPRSADDVPPRDPLRELRAYVQKNLGNALRRGTVAHDDGDVDTRRWRTTNKPPRFAIEPDGPAVPYTAERHREWLARERTVTADSVVAQDIAIYATVETEVELVTRLASFTAAERELFEYEDLRRAGALVKRFKTRPARSRRAIIAALARQLAEQDDE